METVSCIVCRNRKKKELFRKKDKGGESFTLNKCTSCGLEYVSPRPTLEEIGKYYSSGYFTQRTDRGYNNYFSQGVRDEIERVFSLNLHDLDFYLFEKKSGNEMRSLDIGCAAGYFVQYLRHRGWQASGIDVSTDCIDFAKNQGLDVVNGDYLEYRYSEKFDLITMWASIEHLHYPDRFLAKIYRELDDNGRLYISTCRSGLWNFKVFFGKQWRYYNFPEHLFFFSYKTLRKLLASYGFTVEVYKTYGSGIGNAGSLKKKAADTLAKRLGLGDMMLISAKKG